MKEIVFHRSSARTFVILHMLFHIEHVEQVRLLVAFFISLSLKPPSMSIPCSLSSTNAFIYFLSLKLKGSPLIPYK